MSQDLSESDDSDTKEKLPPITGIPDLDCIVRNARLVYIVQQELPAYRTADMPVVEQKIQTRAALADRVVAVLTGMVRELVPDTVVGENHIESAPAGSIAFGSMRLFDTKYENAHTMFRHYYEDTPVSQLPKLLVMCDDKYSDDIARRADVVMDMRVYAGDKNIVQLTDLTHFSGRRQIFNLEERRFYRFVRRPSVRILPLSDRLIRIRTSGTDVVINIRKLALLELQQRKLTIHVGDQKIVIHNHVESALVYNQLNRLLQV